MMERERAAKGWVWFNFITKQREIEKEGRAKRDAGSGRDASSYRHKPLMAIGQPTTYLGDLAAME